jgi:hypothetical protein
VVVVLARRIVAVEDCNRGSKRGVLILRVSALLKAVTNTNLLCNFIFKGVRYTYEAPKSPEILELLISFKSSILKKYKLAPASLVDIGSEFQVSRCID